MSGEFRFRRYRDEAAMQRAAAALAKDGWVLRAWRVRGRQEDVDLAELLPSEVRGAWIPWWQTGTAVWEVLRFMLYVPLAIVTLAWAMVMGRKPVEAVFERAEG